MSEWRPIETYSLAEDEEALFFTASIQKCDVGWHSWNESNGEKVFFNGDITIRPSHWMPLPSPPTEKELTA